MVWVRMARRACVKLHVLVSRWPARRIRLVALFAGHFDVQSSQRISRLGVVELLRRLPALHVMALRALVAQLSRMRVGVARRARGRLAKERLRRVLVLDERSQRGNHVRRGMALFAGHAGVLSIQFIPRQSVVEFLLRWLPADQLEALAIVFQVAS